MATTITPPTTPPAMAPTLGPECCELPSPESTQVVYAQVSQDWGTREHTLPPEHDGQEGVVLGQSTQLRLNRLCNAFST